MNPKEDLNASVETFKQIVEHLHEYCKRVELSPEGEHHYWVTYYLTQIQKALAKYDDRVNVRVSDAPRS